MKNTYASKSSKLAAATLSHDSLFHIGRIVRAFAEIEGIVDLYVGALAKLAPNNIPVLLGQTGISKKVEIAFYLAKIAGGRTLRVHKELFNEAFEGSKNCRNAVAHGILLGKTEDDRYAFLTSKTLEPNAEGTLQAVSSYDEENLKAFAHVAEGVLASFEQEFDIPTLREKRLQQSLLPHRKGLTQQQRGQKPRNRPRSSQG